MITTISSICIYEWTSMHHTLCYSSCGLLAECLVQHLDGRWRVLYCQTVYYTCFRVGMPPGGNADIQCVVVYCLSFLASRPGDQLFFFFALILSIAVHAFLSHKSIPAYHYLSSRQSSPRPNYMDPKSFIYPALALPWLIRSNAGFY